MLYLGCHLSASGGYAAMCRTARSIGANTFQFFTRNPRGGAAKAIDPADAQTLVHAQAVAARSIPNYRTLEAFMDALDKRFHISERHDSGVLVANMIDGSVNAAVRVLRGEFSGDDRTLNTIYQTVILPLFSVLGLRI